jgi:endonuclease YncB( thermonuclease family)
MRFIHVLLPSLIAAVAMTAPVQAQVVTEVESGDEIVVAGIGKVKLLGIEHTDPGPFSVGGNTAPPARTGPEQRPPNAVGGAIAFKRPQPARDLLRQLLLGKTVRIEYDPLVDDRDKGAYVFVGDELINAEMVRQGRAKVDSSRSIAHLQALVQAEQTAKESGVGIWTKAR